MDSAPLALTASTQQEEQEWTEQALVLRYQSRTNSKGWVCMRPAQEMTVPYLHFALKHSISRHRFWSQRDLSWNASCHFPLVPFGASDFTLLSSALLTVKWRRQHYLYSVELCTVGENAHREFLVIWSNSTKVNTHALSPLPPLPLSRVFQSIS